MRTALAIFVAVVNAAGPGVCCCLPKAFATSLPPIAQKSAPRHHACPYCPAAEAPPQVPTNPSPGRQPCPCAERLLTVPVAVPDSPIQPDTTSEQLSVLDVLTEFVPTDCDAVGGPQSDMPFLPSTDRLRVHHALRL